MDFWRKIRTYGFKESCLRQVRRYYIRLFQLECNISMDIQTRNRIGFQFKLADIVDLERISKQNIGVSRHKIQSFHQRLKFEQYPVFVIQNQQNLDICGYYCLAFGDVYQISNVFTQKVDKMTGYFFDDQTFEPYLRQGLHAYSIQKRLQFCTQHNKSMACVHIRAYNRASLNSYQKAGFRKTQVHYFLRFWRFKIHFKRRIRKNIHED